MTVATVTESGSPALIDHTMEGKDPITSLIKILAFFEPLEKDFLSTRLFRWGAKVVHYMRTTRDSDDLIKKFAKERIEFLLTRILVDPIDGTSLVHPDAHPIIERDWVWRKDHHTECYRLFNAVSPFDKQQMEEAPLPHPFVEKITSWLKAYRFFQAGLAPKIILEGSDDEKRFLYSRWIVSAISQRKNQVLQVRTADAMDKQQEQTELMVYSSQQVIDEQEQKNTEHQAWLANQFAQLKDTFERRTQDLTEENDRKQEENKRTIQSLKNEMATDKSLVVIMQCQIDEIVASQGRQNAIFKQALADLREQEERLHGELVQKSKEFSVQISASNQAKFRLQEKLELQRGQGVTKSETL